MKHIANKNARRHVVDLTEFKGSNLYSKRHSKDTYVVYSYGEHFPLWACINGQWYGNQSKTTRTTTKQRNLSMPAMPEKITWCETFILQKIIQQALTPEENFGFVKIA
jgi:hypothetical protein